MSPFFAFDNFLASRNVPHLATSSVLVGLSLTLDASSNTSGSQFSPTFSLCNRILCAQHPYPQRRWSRPVWRCDEVCVVRSRQTYGLASQLWRRAQPPMVSNLIHGNNVTLINLSPGITNNAPHPRRPSYHILLASRVCHWDM